MRLKEKHPTYNPSFVLKLKELIESKIGTYPAASNGAASAGEMAVESGVSDGKSFRDLSNGDIRIA